MIDSLYISALFLAPGVIILSMMDSDYKFKFLISPFLSFSYFNFLCIIFFLFKFGPFEYWFYIFALLPLLLIFKVKSFKDLAKNFTFILILFLAIDTVLNYFTLISLPGNTYNTFDQIYKLFYHGTRELDIGIIPLPMFTSGLFTSYNFDYTLMNIYFIQFIFTAFFSLFNLVNDKKEFIIGSIFLISNLLIFDVFYEMITYRSHSLTASALMILFIYFHKSKKNSLDVLILFVAVFIIFNSRLENLIFGYLYIFAFKILNPEKFTKNKLVISSSSLVSGLYLLIIPQTHTDADLRSNTAFVLAVIILGAIFIYKDFFNVRIFYFTSILFSITYVVIMYLLSKDILRSVVSITYVKLFDPNSGFGLQFLLFLVLIIFLIKDSKTIPGKFFIYFIYIFSISLLIGILQSYIYLPEANLELIENISIFNPIDLSTFRSSVQTLSIFWLFSTSVFLEKTKNI